MANSSSYKRLTDAQVQRKLNQLVKIANELAAEARARWPGSGLLFYEAEGSFHFMSHDDSGTPSERQEGIEMSSDLHCNLDCGAW